MLFIVFMDGHTDGFFFFFCENFCVDGELL